MCYQLQRESGDLRHLSPLSRTVLGQIAKHWNRKKQNDPCFPGIDRLTNTTGVCKRSVISSIKKLSKLGYLKIEKIKGHNFYWIDHIRIHNESMTYEWHFSNSNSDHAKKLECELKSSGFDYKSFLSVQIEEKPGVKMTPGTEKSGLEEEKPGAKYAPGSKAPDPEMDEVGAKYAPSQVQNMPPKEVILKEESYLQDYINKEESKILDFVKSEDNNPFGRNERCVSEKSHATH